VAAARAAAGDALWPRLKRAHVVAASGRVAAALRRQGVRRIAIAGSALPRDLVATLTALARPARPIR
jgi:uroporphyrinogen-III synthase